MMRASALWVAGCGAWASFAAASPDLVVPPPSSTVRFEPGELTRLAIRNPVGKGEIVWALPYTLVNDTGRVRELALDFVLSTDRLRGVSVLPEERPETGPELLAPRVRFVPVQLRGAEHPAARARLATALGTEVLSHAEMHRPLRPGERRIGAAFFAGVPLDVQRIEVYVFGLSPVQRIEIREVDRGDLDPRVVTPDHYRAFLARGVPVVHMRAPREGVEQIRLEPFVAPISPREYAEVARSQSGSREAFERGGSAFRYQGPILSWGAGTRLRQTWILHLAYERVNAAARGLEDYTEPVSRQWVIGLSEAPDH